jgi:hypothetical protein
VLWLASHAADVNFVSREGTKLVKLVEATNADRPIPLVSFVARQRDLRDLVGENLAGSVQVQFSDVLKHWEARFHRITLEDRNLPAIAEKRVLRPIDEAARQTLQGTFDDVMKMRKDVLDTLLTTTADRDMFRKVYPFSPALVQTLIAVSAALQRERTALKLMLQLLVDRRADLELGQLIPVGDLYDAIAEGDEPFSEGMRLHFENAKRLYNQRLLPMLERQHGVTWEAIKLGQADATAGQEPAQRRPPAEDAAAGRAGARGGVAEGPDRAAPGGAEPRHLPLPHPGPRGAGRAAQVPRLGQRDRRDQDHRRPEPGHLDPGDRRRHRADPAGGRGQRQRRQSAQADPRGAVRGTRHSGHRRPVHHLRIHSGAAPGARWSCCTRTCAR